MKTKNLTPFSSDYQPENPGRPKGSKNRSTVARMVLDLSIKVPDDLYHTLKEAYPDILQCLSIEEIMVYSQIHKAIFKGDTAAFRAIMDTAYGTPNRETIDIVADIADEHGRIYLTLNLGNDLSDSEDNE